MPVDLLADRERQVSKSGIPASIVLPNGDRYVATVFKIEDRYENGIPENCLLLHDEAVAEIVGGEEFFIAYILESFTKPKTE
jgi:hypothetical protein